MEKYRKNYKAILLFLLPAFLIYTTLAIIPIVQSFYFSFFEWPGIAGVPLKYVGLKNYEFLFGYKDFIISIKNVIWFVILSLCTQIPMGLIVALTLATYCKGFKVFKVIFFIPIVLSMTSVGLMWYFILLPNNGVLTNLLLNLGLENLTRNWLIDKSTALNSVILITAWVSIGYYMIIFFAAITSISEDVLESAKLDGSVGVHRALHIVLPMIWPVMSASIVLVITGILKIFDIIFIMTKGGPNGLTNVPATLLYNEAFGYNNYGIGSAISTVIFVMSIIFTLVSLRLMQRKSD